MYHYFLCSSKNNNFQPILFSLVRCKVYILIAQCCELLTCAKVESYIPIVYFEYWIIPCHVIQHFFPTLWILVKNCIQTGSCMNVNFPQYSSQQKFPCQVTKLPFPAKLPFPFGLHVLCNIIFPSLLSDWFMLMLFFASMQIASIVEI